MVGSRSGIFADSSFVLVHVVAWACFLCIYSKHRNFVGFVAGVNVVVVDFALCSMVIRRMLLCVVDMVAVGSLGLVLEFR